MVAKQRSTRIFSHLSHLQIGRVQVQLFKAVSCGLSCRLSGFKRGGCSQEGSPYSFAALCLGGGAEREVGPRFVSSHVHSQCLVRSNLVWSGCLPSCRPATGSGITSLVPHTTVLRETENKVLTRIPLVQAHSKCRLVHVELRLASLSDLASFIESSRTCNFCKYY